MPQKKPTPATEVIPVADDKTTDDSAVGKYFNKGINIATGPFDLFSVTAKHKCEVILGEKYTGYAGLAVWINASPVIPNVDLIGGTYLSIRLGKKDEFKGYDTHKKIADKIFTAAKTSVTALKQKLSGKKTRATLEEEIANLEDTDTHEEENIVTENRTEGDGSSSSATDSKTDLTQQKDSVDSSREDAEEVIIEIKEEDEDIDGEGVHMVDSHDSIGESKNTGNGSANHLGADDTKLDEESSDICTEENIITGVKED